MQQAGTEQVLNIAKDFSRYPGPRNHDDGPNSGEDFRDKLLLPALRRAEQEGGTVIVELDGARGYTASFMEEAFGGLVRVCGFTADRLENLLQLKADDRKVQYWVSRVKQYINEAQAVAQPR